MARMDEEPLDGGYDAGAVPIGNTVHRRAGPWTPAVHGLLTYLADQGFTRAPRPLGFDEQGREILTFLEGESVGRRRPLPAWVYAEATLIQVARWLRECHQILANLVPPPDAIWRDGFPWSDGQIVVHNDATIHNAAWSNGQLTGFFDWDFARPATPEWDLAFAAYTWVPLHARSVVAGEGFTDFAGRPRRLAQFLGTCGWSATTGDFLDVVEARLIAHAKRIRDQAAAGDEPSRRLLGQGVPHAIDQGLDDLEEFRLVI
jgi:Phosphotransferase enzyme family